MPTKIYDRPFAFSMGPQRAGTSWLDRYLRGRKDVCLPSGVKEVFFFDRDFERGFTHYASHFHLEPEHKIVMEISTTSFDSVDAPKNLHSIFGSDVKLICPLRNPVIRAYSLYLHYKRYGIVQGDFFTAVKEQPNIIESSFYTRHLERWTEFFGEEKINIFMQEDLERDQDKYVQGICDVLDLPFMPPTHEDREKFNVTTTSKSGALAALGQRGADLLRKYKQYWIINLAKEIGLKKVFFGEENPDASKFSIPVGEEAFLLDRLSEEIELFQKKFPHIRADWLG
ncbi:MAG: hypothetical protein GC136_04820 [Alphaproteobacteria bacterium]|nr:hypothetical protein [Alphaproteobacteria bacterium]